MSASSAAPRHGRRLISTAVAVLLSTAGLASTAGAVTAAPSEGSSASRSQTSKAVAAGRYIVTFADEPAASYEGGVAGYPRTRPDAGRKLDPTRPEVIRYRDRLTKQHDAALTRVGATKLYDYTVATNGVLSDLTAGQARTLSSTAGVRLEKDAIRTLDTTETPAYLGLSEANGLWSKLGGDRAAGTGIIVGVIDSGIWPEAASFAGGELKRDRAGQPVQATGLRGTWFGACVQGEQFSSQNCNDKLIGARYYVAGFGKKNIAQEEYLSPRDGGGHGTHTASTAAGNRVTGVAIDGEKQGSGIASGMAPGADVAAYKVCWEAKPGASAGCFNGDSIAAIDDAVADGVDVINYSVGGSSESSPLDSVEQAYRRASNANVFVANSAGNSGPGSSTLDHPSPWLTTVAASTFRKSEKAVQLGNADGPKFVGASISPALLPQTRLVASAGSVLASADPKLGRLCYPGTLDPSKVRGTIVQCDRGGNGRAEKSVEVKRAGGVGMVLTNTGPNSLNSDYHAVPTVHVDDVAGAAIKEYLKTTAPTAAFVAGSSGIEVPEVAEFSSRGPSTTTGGDILKPDLAAPGVDVLAAVAPPSNFGRSYDYYSGTSMSSPHIAGIGALIRALHKDWSPSEVKSAMMTTARDHATSRDPFAQGAGFVVPNRATDPGLVFPTSANEYRRYMVGLGVQFGAPNNTLTALDGSDLNQASLAIGALAGRQVVTRTVKNVSASSETYTVSENVPGLDITASEPLAVEAGATKTVTLTVTRNGAETGKYAKGSLTFTGTNGHVVRIPVAVKPVAISAPSEISGTGASGSATYTVTAGFTGTLDTSVTGLAAGTTTAGTVSSGAPSTTPNASNAVFPVTIPAGAPLVRFDLDATSTTDDLDLYLYKAGAADPIDFSASAAGDEQLTYTDLPAGSYTLVVNGYDTGGGGAFAFTSYVVPTGDAGNLTVTDGKPVTLASSVELVASWKGLNPSLRYLGVIAYAGATETTIVSIG